MKIHYTPGQYPNQRLNITVRRHSQISPIQQFNDLFVVRFTLEVINTLSIKILIVKVAVFGIPLIGS